MSGPYAEIYGPFIYFKEFVRLAQPHDMWAVSEHHGAWAARPFSEKFKLCLGQLSPLAWTEAIRNGSSSGTVPPV